MFKRFMVGTFHLESVSLFITLELRPFEVPRNVAVAGGDGGSVTLCYILFKLIIIINMPKSLLEYLPEVGSPLGFILYSLILYLIMWFCHWLFSEPMSKPFEDPDVEVKRKAEIERLKQKGLKMREVNKKQFAETTSKQKKDQ